MSKAEPERPSYPNFLVSVAHKEMVYGLTDDEAGFIFKALFAYAETGDVADVGTGDRLVKALLAAMVGDIKEHKAHYLERCEINRINGRVGGLTKAERDKLKRMLATATDC